MVVVHCTLSHCHVSITKFRFNLLFCTFQDMARTSNLNGKKWLRGNNSITIQVRITVIVHCTSSHGHLSINQVLFQSLLYFVTR